jgi:adenylate kinase family enzyme
MLERRADDTSAALENRLSQYQELTLPVCEFYQSSGRLVKIDASQSREAIHEAIMTAVLTEDGQ